LSPTFKPPGLAYVDIEAYYERAGYILNGGTTPYHPQCWMSNVKCPHVAHVGGPTSLTQEQLQTLSVLCGIILMPFFFTATIPSYRSSLSLSLSLTLSISIIQQLCPSLVLIC
jgi:hypothetical protein